MTKENILIVDDEKFFRELFAELLSPEGYRLDSAADGYEALDKIAKNGYDLVILDLMMPGLSGLETLDKAKEIHPDLAVIIATAHGSIESAVTAMKKGAYHYVTKPVNTEEFLHIIQNCLEKKRLEYENLALRREITFLEIGKALASTIELDKLMALILDSAMEVCGAEGGYIIVKPAYMPPEAYPKISRGIAAWETSPEAVWDEKFLEAFENISGCQLLSNLRKEAKFEYLTEKYRIGSAIAADLGYDHDTWGRLVLWRNDLEAPFTFADLRMASLLTTQGAVVLKNALLYKNIQELTVKDDETKAYNRRYLDDFLTDELKRAERYNRFLGVIFLDLDYLKKINDTYGHLIGSGVLRETADLLLSVIRKVDKLVRYGGDEFIAILPETDLTGSLKVAERFRQRVKEHTFNLQKGPPLRMTASVGVAVFPLHGISNEELIRAADQAMYKIKETTRDGVAVA